MSYTYSFQLPTTAEISQMTKEQTIEERINISKRQSFLNDIEFLLWKRHREVELEEHPELFDTFRPSVAKESKPEADKLLELAKSHHQLLRELLPKLLASKEG